mgnify:FL=1|nr:MAG TPA: hypothetical protein [Caudoviricetes sp.]
MHEYKTLLSEADMGPLKKVLSLMDLDFDELKRGITGTINGSSSTGFKMNSNIAKEAKGLTAVFPVLVSESVSVEQAQMIAKAAERKYVTMFQMLFAASQITDAKSAQSYLKKFHNNITSSLDLSDMTVDDVIDFANKLDEEVQTTALTNARITEATKAVLEDLAFNENYTKVLAENLNPVSLNNYKVKTVFGDYKATQVSEANDDYYTVEDRSDSTEWEGRDDNNGNVYKQRTNTTTRRTPITARDRAATLKDKNATLKDKADIISKQIVTTDIKKANEATPSLMIINFVTQADGRDNEIVNTAVIGVKCVIHYIPSSEMMNRMVLKNTDRRGLLNFIRATTGEIQFFRDFLFAIDRAKIDAVAKTNKGSNSRIWKMLEIRANRSKMNTTARADNAACAAITMLVLSKAEVDIIKQSYRLDLSKASTMLSVMKGYNFIGVAVIDEVNEKVDFLYDDGTKNFETISFMSLEREQGAGEYKKMINTLVKGR